MNETMATIYERIEKEIRQLEHVLELLHEIGPTARYANADYTPLVRAIGDIGAMKAILEDNLAQIKRLESGEA